VVRNECEGYHAANPVSDIELHNMGKVKSKFIKETQILFFIFEKTVKNCSLSIILLSHSYIGKE